MFLKTFLKLAPRCFVILDFFNECIILSVADDISDATCCNFLGVEVGGEKFQGVYLPSVDRTRLTYRMNKHTAFVGTNVGGPGCLICF